jgi:hypothetical protein
MRANVSEDRKSLGISGFSNIPLPTTTGYTTKSFDDWDNLIYNFRNTASAGLDGIFPVKFQLKDVNGNSNLGHTAVTHRHGNLHNN